MFEAFGYNRSDMVIRKKIIDCFALTAVGNKICVLEYLELMRYCRLRHSEQFRNSANAHLRLKERKQNLDAGRVAEIRQAIADGRFTINAGAIADRLIASAKELVDAQQQA